mmetsp:Transcript_39230/g.91645  ORF Transcript_39230/g.91645 Transcript_39230/m.91645 type:complete len:241 (-) Transcript_39230:1708-2430(-)
MNRVKHRLTHRFSRRKPRLVLKQHITHLLIRHENILLLGELVPSVPHKVVNLLRNSPMELLINLLLHRKVRVNENGKKDVEQHQVSYNGKRPEPEVEDPGGGCVRHLIVEGCLVHTESDEEKVEGSHGHTVHPIELVSEEEVGAHGVAHEDDEEEKNKVEKVGESCSDSASDEAKPGLKVHNLEHTHDEANDTYPRKRLIRGKVIRPSPYCLLKLKEGKLIRRIRRKLTRGGANVRVDWV